MDVIPTLLDGAVVCTVSKLCKCPALSCELCTIEAIQVHNWVKLQQLPYLIFDFNDEKTICPTFIDELLLVRKRLRIPFLFSGLLGEARLFFEKRNSKDQYPLFLIPEDAIRALRMQNPGLTEIAPAFPLNFGNPISLDFKESFFLPPQELSLPEDP